MIRFNKIRIAGFKSFVDSTDLLIEPGLTGVVGPNGCGKSNLVEALRWVMGETSAKQMRGSGMDDVIFGGTANRPARNMAEVVLHLDNSARVAPAVFNDFDELEISRRIERDKGSTYRVNGKDVRARDVQLLFADAATGARSPALVSQGRIGAIISAKPAQRRVLLEEAAGIAGLHSRRHEAELRLRAAEGNLERLDDILITMDSQLASLKKQARQATRYRNLSDHIRKAEAALYHLRWVSLTAELVAARQHLSDAESRVAALTGQAGNASARQAEQTALLPELRQSEAEAAAQLHRLVVAREGLEAEEERIAQAVEDTKGRLFQNEADKERERALSADADAALRRLAEEQDAIEASGAGQADALEDARQERDAAQDVVIQLEARVNALAEQVATNEAQRTSLTRSSADLATRRDRLAERRNSLTGQREQLAASSQDVAALADAEHALDAAREALEAARARAEASENDRTAFAQGAETAAAKARESEAVKTRLEAEERALADLVATGDSEDWPAVINDVTVDSGYEAALGAALGDDLSAPTDTAAPVHWATLNTPTDAPALPAGTEPLSRHVRAPAALARRLSQIGVVDSEQTAIALMGSLAQGQRLVSRTGGLWRWDGFTVGAGAPTAAAVRLEQQNRLGTVREELRRHASGLDDVQRQATQAREKAERAQEDERASRATLHAADVAFGQARNAVAEVKERAAEQTSRLGALAEQITDVEHDLAEATTAAEEAAAQLAALPEQAGAREQVETMRAELSEERTVLVDRQSAHDVLIRAAESRRQRLSAIEQELASWRERAEGARGRMEQLEDRRLSLNEELDRLSTMPGALIAKRHALAEQIETAEQARKAAADTLASSEAKVADADRALKDVERELATAREDRVRAEGSVEQGSQAAEGIIERVREKLDCTPEKLGEVADIKEDAPLPELEAVEKKVDRLHRERDTMGPVNLRAEHESNEMIEQIDGLTAEKSDLTVAIEKLRKGISELNREGRQRLLASFEEVDRHFQELFVRLFGGGRAHLELVESDDPLEAGLEIMASPPGKRLQSLSLLSGGEQAMTATALIFAVFLTNPAPICVLDEVDAPLDDANVDRFCSMLEEMAKNSGTRFVVITHHRMTMARMDRLFGVTMGERGVSQLVSVDLQRAEELRLTA